MAAHLVQKMLSRRNKLNSLRVSSLLRFLSRSHHNSQVETQLTTETGLFDGVDDEEEDDDVVSVKRSARGGQNDKDDDDEEEEEEEESEGEKEEENNGGGG